MENHQKSARNLSICRQNLSSAALFRRFQRRAKPRVSDPAESPYSQLIHENHQINHNHQIYHGICVICERRALQFLASGACAGNEEISEKLRPRRLSHSLSSAYSEGLQLAAAVMAAQVEESENTSVISSTAIGAGLAFVLPFGRLERKPHSLHVRHENPSQEHIGKSGDIEFECKLIMTCRIQRFVTEEDHVVLCISGQIREQDMDLLRGFLERETNVVALDLKDVVLVDRETVKLLARCESNGTELRNCPPYIREWVTREKGTRTRRSKE